MTDFYDDGRKIDPDDRLKPLNTKEIPKRQTAVSLKESVNKKNAPTLTAAGYGEMARKIIELAQENGINIREDSALAEMLAEIELDSPIPSEAFMAVAEILSYVYRANGKPDPFDAVLNSDTQEE